MRYTSFGALLVALAFTGLGSAHAANNNNDQTFTTKAAQGGLAEVQTGQLVEQKASSQQVKDFGQMLVQDHTKANQQLRQIAQKDNLNVPSQPSQDEKSEMQKLQGLSGSQFDHQFLQAAVEDHKKDIDLFQNEASSGDNADLKAFAQNTLPVLKKHLQMAQSLSGSQK